MIITRIDTYGFHIIVAQRRPVRIHDNQGPLTNSATKRAAATITNVATLIWRCAKPSYQRFLIARIFTYTGNTAGNITWLW